MEHIYPALDLLIQTSRSEAMPLALLEAMASGVAVIAIGVGGVAEIIEVGTTGLTVSAGDWPGVLSPYPGDWEGIALAAIDLLNCPDQLQAMGRAGRKRAEELFDLSDSVRQTSSMFQRLRSRDGRNKRLSSPAIVPVQGRPLQSNGSGRPRT